MEYRAIRGNIASRDLRKLKHKHGWAAMPALPLGRGAVCYGS